MKISSRGHHVISSQNTGDPAPPAPHDIISNTESGHHVLKHLQSSSDFQAQMHKSKHSRNKTMSFAMPNGRIQSVRISSMRKQASGKRPPQHPSMRNIPNVGTALGAADTNTSETLESIESQPLMDRRSSFSKGSDLAASKPPSGTSPSGVQIELGRITSM